MRFTALLLIPMLLVGCLPRMGMMGANGGFITLKESTVRQTVFELKKRRLAIKECKQKRLVEKEIASKKIEVCSRKRVVVKKSSVLPWFLLGLGVGGVVAILSLSFVNSNK